MAKTIGELQRGDRIFALNDEDMSLIELIVTDASLENTIRIEVKFTNSFFITKCYYISPIFKNKTTTLSISTHNSQCAIREILNNRMAYNIRLVNINYRRKWLR